MSFLSPPKVDAPVQPAAPPPVLAPQGSKPGSKPQAKSFLGAADIANPVSGGSAGKTLLGA